MEYIVDDRGLGAAVFLPFVNQIWPGEYDRERTQAALTKTMNITAYEGERLVGCLRILSDGCYFGTIRSGGSAAGSCSLPGKTLQRCCISARSRGWKRSMRKTGARGACNPM